MLEPDVIDMLRCPNTGSDVHDEDGSLVSAEGRPYPIVDDIVVFAGEAEEGLAKKDFHESLADRYTHKEQLKGITGIFYSMYVRETISFVQRYQPQRLLDIGGGEGAIFTDFTYQRFIVDIAMKRLRRNTDGVSLRFCADGMNLPFKDGVFDAVLLIACLEHVVEPRRMIHEAHRVLKEGGKVAMLIPNDISMSVGRALQGKRPARSPGHLFFFTPARLRNMVRGKFKIVDDRYLPFRHLPFWLNMYGYMEGEKI